MPEKKGESEKKCAKEIFDPSKDRQNLANEVERQKLVDSASAWPDRSWLKEYKEEKLPKVEAGAEALAIEKKVLENLARYHHDFWAARVNPTPVNEKSAEDSLGELFKAVPENFRKNTSEISGLEAYLKT